MTQAQLIRHLAERCGVNNKAVRLLLEELAKTAKQETKKEGLFILPGIGRLFKATRKARMGRNPAKTVVKFRVAKAAKDVIAPVGKRK